MKIAIIGTRGIPNNYGGFEEFAEQIAIQFSEKELTTYVYNPHYYRAKPQNEKIIIRYKYFPEKILGSFSSIIYDYLCLKDALNVADFVICCGYSSIAPSIDFFKKEKHRIYFHMDGIEWQRSKWSNLIKKYIIWSEKKIVNFSNNMISDNMVIADYFLKKYQKSSTFIPFGANLEDNYNHNFIESYGLTPQKYHLIISRAEPENNIETIIKAFLISKDENKLVILMDINQKYGRYIFNKYQHYSNLIFLGTIFDQEIISNIRHFSKLYFHGHSVGGTNPSLLQAMASGCNIIAHDNDYNKSVLDFDAMYFSNINSLVDCIVTPSFSKEQVDNNYKKIKNIYNWKLIADTYVNLFENF